MIAGPTHTFTITGLSTGLWDISVGAPKFLIDKNIWMSIQFRTPDGLVPTRTGPLIRGDWGLDAGTGRSHALAVVFDEQKNVLGLSWFGDPFGASFLLGIQGKKTLIPEPTTLTLLVLGGLVAGRRQR